LISRQDVAVHDEQVVTVRGFHQSERAGRPERLIFADLLDVDAEAAAVAEMLLDLIALVVPRDADVTDAGLVQLSNDDPSSGRSPIGSMGFGARVGERPKACPEAAGCARA
jgi:hypothetical protein